MSPIDRDDDIISRMKTTQLLRWVYLSIYITTTWYADKPSTVCTRIRKKKRKYRRRKDKNLSFLLALLTLDCFTGFSSIGSMTSSGKILRKTDQLCSMKNVLSATSNCKHVLRMSNICDYFKTGRPVHRNIPVRTYYIPRPSEVNITLKRFVLHVLSRSIDGAHASIRLSHV